MLQSVSRALDILITVSDMRGEPITLGQIAQKTDLNISTCAHIVKTLCEKGFLSQVSRTAGYVLGAYAYYLTRYKTFQKELVSICDPVLKWLQRKTGHTALLAILVDGEKFVISYAEDGRGNLHDRGELYRGDIYRSATGRAMLANMRRTELQKLVEQIGLPGSDAWPGIRSFDGLVAELHRIANEKVVCVLNDKTSDYDALLGVSIRAPQTVNCAVGLGIHQESPPTQAELDVIKGILNVGVREINRRLRFEQDGL